MFTIISNRINKTFCNNLLVNPKPIKEFNQNDFMKMKFKIVILVLENHASFNQVDMISVRSIKYKYQHKSRVH